MGGGGLGPLGLLTSLWFETYNINRCCLDSIFKTIKLRVDVDSVFLAK